MSEAISIDTREDRDALVKRLWNDGVSGVEIARRIGIAPARFYELIGELRTKDPEIANRRKLRMGRPDRKPERDAEIARMKNDGWTDERIALEVGLTRSSVVRILGDMRREGVALPPRIVKPRKVEAEGACGNGKVSLARVNLRVIDGGLPDENHSHPAGGGGLTAPVRPRQASGPAAEADVLPPPAAGPVPFLGRRLSQCPWILDELGAKGERMCCGARRKPGSGWCEAHHARAMVPISEFHRQKKMRGKGDA